MRWSPRCCAQLEMFAQADERRRVLAGVLDRLNRGGREQVVVRGHQLPPVGSKDVDTRGRPGGARPAERG